MDVPCDIGSPQRQHRCTNSLSVSLSLSSTHSLSHTLAHTYMRTKAGVAGCCVICRWDQKQQTLLYLFNNFGILSLSFFISPTLAHKHTLSLKHLQAPRLHLLGLNKKSLYPLFSNYFWEKCFGGGSSISIGMSWQLLCREGLKDWRPRAKAKMNWLASCTHMDRLSPLVTDSVWRGRVEGGVVAK